MRPRKIHIPTNYGWRTGLVIEFLETECGLMMKYKPEYFDTENPTCKNCLFKMHAERKRNMLSDLK